MPTSDDARRVLLLLSGGIDSPVAGWLLKEQGLDVGSIHFSLEPFTDDSPETKSRAAAEALGLGPLHVATDGTCFGELTKTCDHRLYFVLSKRLMLRAAARFGREKGYDAIATGENLGQVSSQTLDNLACIHTAADLPVLTPLLGYDKEETIRISEHIGVLEMSTGPEVCDVLGPDDPKTAATRHAVEKEEAKLDLDELTDRLVASIAT